MKKHPILYYPLTYIGENLKTFISKDVLMGSIFHVIFKFGCMVNFSNILKVYCVK